jgi:hypothetical protein
VLKVLPPQGDANDHMCGCDMAPRDNPTEGVHRLDTAPREALTASERARDMARWYGSTDDERALESLLLEAATVGNSDISHNVIRQYLRVRSLP